MSVLKTLRALRLRPQGRPSEFELRYWPAKEEVVTVGRLSFDGDVWTFQYDGAYKLRSDLRPIEGFDDEDKVYRSSVLFPFFAVRIPDVDRDDVKKQLSADRLQDPEQTDLLRIFGRRTLSSPSFELLPV